MSRSNYDKPFYVDVGTSVAAIRCASNGDVIDSMDHYGRENAIKIVERTCDRMNKEAEQFYASTGNAAAIRKALIIVYDWILKAGNVLGYPDTEQKRRQLYDMMTKALSAPPRNCDVGTAEEQARRYHNFAGRYNPCSYKGYARCAEDCPVRKKLTQEGHGELLCQLEWYQMPYEEGGAK